MSASWFSVSKATLIDILRKLGTVFDTKADSFHTHTKSDITDFAHDHPLGIEAASTATSAINLDPNAIYKLTAGGKTFIFKTPADNDHYAWADITGKPSSYPPSAHTHTVSQIMDFPSTMPPSSHTHGNIQNGGTLQTNDVAIANGDKLVITDSSDSSKIARASIAFDGSTATKCLTQKGTWESFTNNAGTVTLVKVGSTSYSPSSGVVSLPAYPTTLPASDVYSWAKASSKPSYTLDEVTDGSTRKLANYLPLSGGTLTGNLTPNGGIKWTSTGLPEHTNPSYLMVIDAFADGGRTKWANKSNVAVGKAEKLSTARSIALGGDFTGSANFDGSANIVINSNFYYSTINSGNQSNYPWHRIACCSGKTGQFTDVDAILDIRHAFNGGGYGRIKISLRTNSTNSGVQISATWLYRYGFSADAIKIACWGVTGQAVYADVFVYVSTYARALVYQVEGSRAWTLVDSNEVNNTTASDPKTSTECWASIGAAGTALHNKAYTSIVNATDGGTVGYAKSTEKVYDVNGSNFTTFAYSKAGLEYSDYTWLAAWNGYELRAVNKNQFAQASHTHGNIQNGGTLQTNDITIANGDKLVVTDSSDSSKIARASISFDGSTTTKCLTQKGTWATFLSSHQDISGKLDKSGGTMTGTLTTRSDNNNGDIIPTTECVGSIGLASKRYASVYTNSLKIGKLGDSLGSISMYNTTSGAEVYLSASGITGERIMSFPDKSGTIALTSDIVDSKVLQSENDTSTSFFPVLLSSQVTSTSDFTGSTYKSKNLQFSPKNADLCIYGANSKLAFEVWCQGADTTTSSREVLVKIGNDTAKGTSGNRYGILRLYSQQTYKADIMTAGTYTANRTFTLPDKTGTVALTSDIPTVGTAAAKNYTTSVTSESSNLVTSGGVYSYLNSNYIKKRYAGSPNVTINSGARVNVATSVSIPSGCACVGMCVDGADGANWTELVLTCFIYASTLYINCYNPNNYAIGLNKLYANFMFVKS